MMPHRSNNRMLVLPWNYWNFWCRKNRQTSNLPDDNFSSIAAAVEEGRRVYDNLLKSLAFLLPTNLGLCIYIDLWHYVLFLLIL